MPASTRAATVAAQDAFPLRTLVRFLDENQATRVGVVVNHKKGLVVIESPPWKKGALPKPIWELVAKRFKVEPRLIQRF